MEPVIRALVPFFIALMIGLLLVMFIPQITLFLPGVFGVLT